MMSGSKEDEMLIKHLKDLIHLSYQRMIPVFTNFFGMHELSLGFLALEEFYGKGQYQEGVHFQWFGGYPNAERKLFCFLCPEQVCSVTEEEAPIRCMKISPSQRKFGESLAHRDYLGTILGLGIVRNQIGDILVERDSEFASSTAYVFCKEDKSDLIQGIDRVRHTTVKVEEVVFAQTGWQPSFREISGSVSSFRLDALLALVLRLSRAKVLSLIQENQVAVNGRVCTENAKRIEEGDILSVRGYGRFLFDKAGSCSKKGRYHITMKQSI